MAESLIEKAMREDAEDYYEADCSNPECDHSQRVEPDACYKCPECKKGMIRSSMVEAGLI